jgi:DivIVA domain-containing protein
MDELGMANRRFSLGARGYNQDEVDAYLTGIAERMTGPNANPAREASRLSIASFSVVTLGYSRSEVNRYLSELRETLERRAERRPAGAISVADEPEVEVVEPAAAEEPAEVAETQASEQESEPAEPKVEKPQAVEPELEEPADIVSAAGNGSSANYAARVTPAVNGDAAAAAVAPDDERAALFATALDLRIEGAVAMTSDELRFAIDDARGVEEAPAADQEPVVANPQDTVAEDGDDLRGAVMAALHEIRATVEALELLVARDLPAEEAVEEPVAEPDPEPAAVIQPSDNGHEPAPQREPIRYRPVGYAAEPRPGLLNLTRDIIRMARGGMVTRR